MNQNESIFRNSIKVDLPKDKPIFAGKDIGTKILIDMPNEKPIFKTESEKDR